MNELPHGLTVRIIPRGAGGYQLVTAAGHPVVEFRFLGTIEDEERAAALLAAAPELLDAAVGALGQIEDTDGTGTCDCRTAPEETGGHVYVCAACRLRHAIARTEERPPE